MDSFELLNVLAVYGAPGCRALHLLNHRLDERSVALGLDLAWASTIIFYKNSATLGTPLGRWSTASPYRWTVSSPPQKKNPPKKQKKNVSVNCLTPRIARPSYRLRSLQNDRCVNSSECLTFCGPRSRNSGKRVLIILYFLLFMSAVSSDRILEITKNEKLILFSKSATVLPRRKSR